MLIAIAAIALLALAFGLLLGYSSIRFHVEGDPIVEKIEALLPQTQCGQCSFPGCRAYAEALAQDEAEINACPPGGETTMIALADLLGKDPVPLEGAAAEEKPKAVAVIREDECIGCTSVSSVSGRRHSGFCQAHAHGHSQRVYRLRAVPAALSGGMYRHGAA